MAYRKKTYIVFDGDNDMHYYRLMTAWAAHENALVDERRTSPIILPAKLIVIVPQRTTITDRKSPWIAGVCSSPT
jgi:hypothetical protein